MDRFGKTHPPCYCSCLAELLHSTLPPAGAISMGSRQGCGDEREAVILVLRLLAWSQSGPESQLASVLRVAGSSPSLSHPRALNLEHTHTYTHARMYTHSHIHTYSHTYSYIHTHIFTNTHTYILTQYTLTHILTHSHTLSHTHTHTYMLAHVHMYAHMLTHCLQKAWG